jgi:antitoxin ParD1/3/4
MRAEVLWHTRPLEDVTMSRTVDLGDQLENFVTGLVASGRYASEDQVLREGVRLILEREARLASLDEAIAKGVEAAETGNSKPASEVFARLEAKYRALAESAG